MSYQFEEDKEEDEVEIKLESLKNGRKVKLTFTSTRAMDTHDFIVVLESYLQDLLNAYKEMPDEDSDKH